MTNYIKIYLLTEFDIIKLFYATLKLYKNNLLSLI